MLRPLHLSARRAAALAVAAASLVTLSLGPLTSSVGAAALRPAADPAPVVEKECPTGYPEPAPTGSTRSGTGNPLDDYRWAAAHGRAEGVWRRHCNETDPTRKRLLGKVALQPRAAWFNDSFTPSDLESRVRQYITVGQDGDARRLVHLAAFRLGGENMGATPSAAFKASYRAWYDALARGIGRSPVVVVLEPDLAGVYESQISTTNRTERLRLVRYAASRLAKQPNAFVYIDGTSGDWLKPAKAATMLKAAGIAHVRGFALGATHYTKLTGDSGRNSEIRFAHQLAGALARVGIGPNHRRAVIDTSDNARGFTKPQYHAEYPNRPEEPWPYGGFDNAPVCTTTNNTTCVTLGIPPTWNVASTRWGLGTYLRAEARTHVDAYLWFGKSWNWKQSYWIGPTRALSIARSTPWQ